MAFYFRKSINFGPFRFNFSKSGIGASVGVKGLRLGATPKGFYVHAGYGGIYYRQTLSRNAVNQRSKTKAEAPSFGTATPEEIKPTSIVAMTDGALKNLVADLTIQKQKAPIHNMLVWLAVLGSLVMAILFVQTFGWPETAIKTLGWPLDWPMTGYVAFFICSIPLVALISIAESLGKWIDDRRIGTVLFFDLDGETSVAYEKACEKFGSLIECDKKWRTEVAGEIAGLHEWKRKAGAAQSVDRLEANAHFNVPAVLKTNVLAPTIQSAGATVCFLPNFILIELASGFSAAEYGDTTIDCASVRFIEDQQVPPDATIVGQTWKHPNLDGTADLRFANNYEVPISCYDILRIITSSGLSLEFQFSRTGIVAPFVDQIKLLPRSG